MTEAPLGSIVGLLRGEPRLLVAVVGLAERLRQRIEPSSKRRPRDQAREHHVPHALAGREDRLLG